MAQVSTTARTCRTARSRSSLRRIARPPPASTGLGHPPRRAGFFKGLASEAFNAYGNYERFSSLSLETLAERDLMEAATVEKTLVVGQKRVELTEQERRSSATRRASATSTGRSCKRRPSATAS